MPDDHANAQRHRRLPVTGMRSVVVGTGVIGTSIGLTLARRGVQVLLADTDPEAVRIAARRGAGEPLPAAGPAEPADVAVLAVPPAATAEALLGAQKRGLARAYTDTASVKVLPLAEAVPLGCDLSSFVAGHPLAGSERSGPRAARAGLFEGRPWVLCPTGETRPAALAAVTELVRACGARPYPLPAAEHDRAVALISHLPHVLSSALAARLAAGEPTAVELAGQGLRDVTRIAAGSPRLWLEILAGNAGPIAEMLEWVVADLAETAGALRALGDGVRDERHARVVADLLERGRAGRARIVGTDRAV